MTVLELLEESGVLYGSRAFGVETGGSDYDYVIMQSFIDENIELFKNVDRDTRSSNLEYTPNSNHYMMYKVSLTQGYADILVVADEEDLQVVADAVHDCQMVPTYMMENKEVRIGVYQQALIKYGWLINPDYGNRISGRDIF